MSWSVYSSEDHPKWDADNNCQTDYIQALGVQVLFKAHQWTRLEDFYRHVRYESWIDAAGEGRESIVTGKQLAERIVGDFGSRGFAAVEIDKVSDAQRQEIEAAAEKRNMEQRLRHINRFEQQFRTKMQGGPGRWTPTIYEAECYKLHKMRPPETVQREREDKPDKPTVIIQEPDPEMIARLVAQQVALELEKRTAPSKR